MFTTFILSMKSKFTLDEENMRENLVSVRNFVREFLFDWKFSGNSRELLVALDGVATCSLFYLYYLFIFNAPSIDNWN